MTRENDQDRRTFLQGAALASGGLLLTSFAPSSWADPRAQTAPAAKPDETAEDVSPAEDLMREHGVLNRILLIYDEAARRIDAKADLPPEPLAKASDLIRHFIEEYHEKLEEEHLFPRFLKANRLVELVNVLLMQHGAGRRLTAEIKQRATAAALKNPDESGRLLQSLRSFNRMYRPH